MFQEKRTNKRISVYLPINYDVLGQEKKKFGSTTTKDLSLDGLRISTDDFFPVGTQFLIKLHLSDINRVMGLEAENRWSLNTHFSDSFQSGLRFRNLDLQQKKILEEYLNLKTTLGEKGG